MSLSYALTLPSTNSAYASGDLVANSTTAGSVVPLSWHIGTADEGTMIRRIRIKKSTTSVTLASFRVHLYESSPTVTNGDNGVWLSTFSNYMGAFDVTCDKVFSDASQGVGTPSTGSEVVVSVTTGAVDKTIYGLVEARAAYDAGDSEILTVTLELV